MPRWVAVWKKKCIRNFSAEACINSPLSGQGHTALWLALGLQDRSFAESLVARGCDINLVSSTGDTMLHDAIGKSNADAALFLINHNCKIDIANNRVCTWACGMSRTRSKRVNS